ncbi:MAG: glutathione S-transferase family protein [Gammaproteobacteria bacterium]|nr:glutathione S-transferase family protein [Gammaproteobacteria bacterium]
MLKLHGVRFSNYYSLAKAALLEKGVEFEEVKESPAQSDEFLAKSPMGRVPVLGTDEGFFSESWAIVDYLERVQPEPALLPAEPFARAKTIELSRHIELNVELVARRCLGAAFFGAEASEDKQAETKEDLAKGVGAVQRLMACDPYAAGAEFTAADPYAFFSFGLSGQIAQRMFDMDILADAPEIKALLGRLATRESIAKVVADQRG